MLLSLMAVLAVALSGCIEERVVKPSFASLRAQADQPNAANDTGDRRNAQPGTGGWAILLADLKGDDRYYRAQQANAQLHGHNLPQLWSEDNGTNLKLYSGRFENPNDPEAQLSLRAVTSVELDGDRPFKHAAFVPLKQDVNFQFDPLDLRQYTGYYTLEVAIFTPEYAGDRKAAAVQLTRELREQSVDAYFYHGPNNSSVCLGLFYESDFVVEGITAVPGPRMTDFQKQHPEYEINGVDANDLPPPPEGALPRPNRSYFVKVL